MKRIVIVLSLILALGVAVALPSSTQPAMAASHTQSHPAAFDKTKFVAHLGAAYFAFHHFAYKPYKDGKLGRTHIVNDIKAAAALLFAYHEVKTAYNLANGSKSRTLQILVSPLNKLGTAFSALSSKVKRGQVSSSDMEGVNTQANGFQTLSKSSGYGFQDKQTAVPGA